MRKRNIKKQMWIDAKEDGLGRIVIPKEIREKFEIKANEILDIYVENHVISLVKDSSKCASCSSTRDLIDYNNKHVCNKYHFSTLFY